MDAQTRKKIIVEYYDTYAQKYGEEYKTTVAGRYFLKKKIDIAMKMGGFKQGSSILDAGCANGYFSLVLAQRGFKVLGIDISKENIEECKRRAKALGIKNAKFVVADLESLKGIKNNQFDGVISFAALRYVPDVEKAVRELYRVTKPSGRVVVDFPNKYSPWFIIFQRFAWKYILPQDKECDLHYTIRESKRFIEKAGFKEIKVRVDFWIARTTHNILAYPFILLDKIMSSLPIVNKLGGAILVKGTK